MSDAYTLEFEMPGQGERWYEIQRTSDGLRIASVSVMAEREARIMVDALNGLSRDEANHRLASDYQRLLNTKAQLAVTEHRLSGAVSDASATPQKP